MSGNPPITFPPNPTTGQTYSAAGVTWQWNGTAWVNANTGTNFVPVTGGTMQGPLALQGITDGSAAQAGQVGEVITVVLPNRTNVAANAFQVAAQTTLQPGDWELSASCWLGSFATPAAANAAWLVISLSSTTDQGFPRAGFGFTAGTINLVWLQTGPFRFNITAATTIYLLTSIGNSNYSSGSGGSSDFLRARRMR